MSVNSEATLSELSRRKRTVEILEPGVSIVNPGPRYRRSVLILTRVFFAVVFLGCGVVAVVYSINASKKHQDEGTHNVPLDEFNIFHNQIALEGVLTVEHNATVGVRQYDKYDIQWIQDETHQRLVFSKSDRETKKLLISYYVFENHTLLVKPGQKCDFNPIGYEDFIRLFGVVGLTKSDKDTVKLNGKYEQVELYEGTPVLNLTATELLELPGYENGKPRLAFGFGFPNLGITCGWQMYFDPLDDKQDVDIDWVEFWFNDIKDEEPDAEYFVGYTKYCVKNENDDYEVQ
ncbi:hypothetical protein M3Y95_01171500 [Aphelenchoides besseyi]|nr:hypothetical protein M3Y95_01171500 [Aphelenchoides besseyi]